MFAGKGICISAGAFVVVIARRFSGVGYLHCVHVLLPTGMISPITSPQKRFCRRGLSMGPGPSLRNRCWGHCFALRIVSVLRFGFRQQQIALQKLFSGNARGAEFESKLRLKVMTFDSCQGEERGIIFYGLVASQHSDRLSWIFPVSLEQADADVQDKLRREHWPRP